MKTLCNYFLIPAIAVLFIYSCGNDTVTNNNGNSGNTIFYSLDSFTLRTSNFGFHDTGYTNISIFDLDSFKVSFNVYTNNDSNSYDYANFSIIDNGNNILEYTLHHDFLQGQPYIFYGHSDSALVNKTINLNLGLRNTVLPTPEKYISIRNFKIESK